MHVSDSQCEICKCPENQPQHWLSTLAYAAILGLLLIVASTFLYGKTGFEKTLTVLTFPIQFAWLLLSGWTLSRLTLSLRKKLKWRRLAGPLLLWIVFSVCGSPVLSDACILYLETQEQAYDPRIDPPLDMLVVLGGGTSQGPTRAEVGDSGDRVLRAAQLFHQGHAKLLITTGSDLPRGSGKRTSPAEQTLEIWKELGIPPANIETLAGINTYAELQSLSQRLHVQVTADQEPRVGLLTSAWHLARAMRLAHAAGLKHIIPVAADHRQQIVPRMLWEYIPAANNFLQLERCQRELIAKWVSR